MEVMQIETEQLKNCIFTKSTGYSSGYENREKSRRMHLSMLLSHVHEGNARIVFNTMDGYREILANVWGSSERFIVLKGGSFIPVDAVVSVDLE